MESDREVPDTRDDGTLGAADQVPARPEPTDDYLSALVEGSAAAPFAARRPADKERERDTVLHSDVHNDDHADGHIDTGPDPHDDGYIDTGKI